MSTKGGKGLFAKDKRAGLFFPHKDEKVRLPAPGETWHLVEGPKDAAALHGLGLHACGLNTCRLAAKFVRLFAGVDVVLIPDRDKAGEKGSQHSARVLHGVAKSVRVAVLPAEFKESGGDDVRDILKQLGGEQLVRQAIDDAQPVAQSQESGGEPSSDEVVSEIELPTGNPINLVVSAAGKKPQRLVTATCGKVAHRDNIDTNSSVSRDRFIKKLASKWPC